MSEYAGKRSRVEATATAGKPTAAQAPGKQTLVQLMDQLASDARPSDRAVHAAAERGTATPATTLPFRDSIQRVFGHHDISGVQAHVGSEASAATGAMGATAYATGNHVVLGKSPDLFTAAHEAAHVVQQRGGVQLRGGVGESGDRYERHANDVAALVIQGKSAERLLDEYTGGRPSTAAPGVQPSVQRLNDNEREALHSYIIESMRRSGLHGEDFVGQIMNAAARAGSLEDARNVVDRVIGAQVRLQGNSAQVQPPVPSSRQAAPPPRETPPPHASQPPQGAQPSPPSTRAAVSAGRDTRPPGGGPTSRQQSLRSDPIEQARAGRRARRREPSDRNRQDPQGPIQLADLPATITASVQVSAPFGTFTVVPDATTSALALNQMRVREIRTLERGWNNILAGRGMMTHGNHGDVAAWRRMVQQSMADSPTLRRLITDIGNDRDPRHAITANLGRRQPGVLIDSFGNGQVDLDDLDHFPAAPSALNPNEMTLGEQIVHILAERRAAQTSAAPTAFAPAHATATRAHNQYRAERGQPAEISAVAQRTAGGGLRGTTRYTDGTSQEIEFDADGNIVGMRKP
jgi:hypothetical protein